jgi:hypothetical protein
MNKREEIRKIHMESIRGKYNSKDIMNRILMQYGGKKENMSVQDTYSSGDSFEEEPAYKQSTNTMKYLIKQTREINFPQIVYRTSKIKTRFRFLKKIMIRLIGFIMTPQGNINENDLKLIEEMMKIIEMNHEKLIKRIKSLEDELSLMKSIIDDK